MPEPRRPAKGAPIRLGLIGCGDFGEYCLDVYSALDGIQPTAVADTVAERADRLAERFSLASVHDPRALIARADVDLVHLATPPASHYPLATAALTAGKHVLCEKPLAVKLAHADAMLAAAAKAECIMPVNFVLRHSPVTDMVKAVIDSGVLGRCLHVSFENYASDAKLVPEHWFWDKSVSGGIFIEHAVHFFDLYDHWLGPGEVVSAHAEVREHSTAEDRVMCLTRHAGGATVNAYHGFDQPGCLDRQSHHLLFETGDVLVRGWIPETLELTAIVDDDGHAELARLCGGRIEAMETFDTPERQSWRGRWVDRHVTRKIRLTAGSGLGKNALYHHSIAALMADQLAYLADPAHPRRVTEHNGRAALALATAADELATQSRKQ